jgi:hypothetical protein
MNYIFMKNEELKKIEEQIKEIESKINDPDLCFGTASVWSRITGYWRPIENWCAGKKAEYAGRIEYQPFGTRYNGDKQWVEKLLNRDRNTV